MSDQTDLSANDRLSDKDIVMMICPYKAMVDKIRHECGNFYFMITDNGVNMDVDLRIGSLPSKFGKSDNLTKKSAYETFMGVGCEEYTYIICKHFESDLVDIRAYEM